MKRLLMLVMFPLMVYGQGISVGIPNEGTGEASSWFYTVTDTTGGTVRVGSLVRDRTFTSVTSDTLQVVPVFRGKTLWVHISAKDSCSVLPYYRISMDAVTWNSRVPLDSLKITTEAFKMKAWNLSTVADSTRYIQVIVDFSVKAYAKGTTTPTYSATYAIKRD